MDTAASPQKVTAGSYFIERAREQAAQQQRAEEEHQQRLREAAEKAKALARRKRGGGGHVDDSVQMYNKIVSSTPRGGRSVSAMTGGEEAHSNTNSRAAAATSPAIRPTTASLAPSALLPPGTSQVSILNRSRTPLNDAIARRIELNAKVQAETLVMRLAMDKPLWNNSTISTVAEGAATSPPPLLGEASIVAGRGLSMTPPPRPSSSAAAAPITTMSTMPRSSSSTAAAVNQRGGLMATLKSPTHQPSSQAPATIEAPLPPQQVNSSANIGGMVGSLFASATIVLEAREQEKHHIKMQRGGVGGGGGGDANAHPSSPPSSSSNEANASAKSATKTTDPPSPTAILAQPLDSKAFLAHLFDSDRRIATSSYLLDRGTQKIINNTTARAAEQQQRRGGGSFLGSPCNAVVSGDEQSRRANGVAGGAAVSPSPSTDADALLHVSVVSGDAMAGPDAPNHRPPSAAPSYAHNRRVDAVNSISSSSSKPTRAAAAVSSTSSMLSALVSVPRQCFEPHAKGDIRVKDRMRIPTPNPTTTTAHHYHHTVGGITIHEGTFYGEEGAEEEANDKIHSSAVGKGALIATLREDDGCAADGIDSTIPTFNGKSISSKEARSMRNTKSRAKNGAKSPSCRLFNDSRRGIVPSFAKEGPMAVRGTSSQDVEVIAPLLSKLSTAMQGVFVGGEGGQSYARHAAKSSARSAASHGDQKSAPGGARGVAEGGKKGGEGAGEGGEEERVKEEAFYQYGGDITNGMRHGQGVFVMKGHATIRGEFRDGELTGKGVKQWLEDGSTYEGYFLNGEPHGLGGIYVGVSSGEYYEGGFAFGVRDGYGVLKKHPSVNDTRRAAEEAAEEKARQREERQRATAIGRAYKETKVGGSPNTASGRRAPPRLPLHFTYRGNFARGKPHDPQNGLLINHANNSEMRGGFAKGVPHGDIIITSSNGDVFSGRFVEGYAKGDGVFACTQFANPFIGVWRCDDDEEEILNEMPPKEGVRQIERKVISFYLAPSLKKKASSRAFLLTHRNAPNGENNNVEEDDEDEEDETAHDTRVRRERETALFHSSSSPMREGSHGSGSSPFASRLRSATASATANHNAAAATRLATNGLIRYHGAFTDGARSAIPNAVIPLAVTITPLSPIAADEEEGRDEPSLLGVSGVSATLLMAAASQQVANEAAVRYYYQRVLASLTSSSSSTPLPSDHNGRDVRRKTSLILSNLAAGYFASRTNNNGGRTATAMMSALSPSAYATPANSSLSPPQAEFGLFPLSTPTSDTSCAALLSNGSITSPANLMPGGLSPLNIGGGGGPAAANAIFSLMNPSLAAGKGLGGGGGGGGGGMLMGIASQITSKLAMVRYSKGYSSLAVEVAGGIDHNNGGGKASSKSGGGVSANVPSYCVQHQLTNSKFNNASHSAAAASQRRRSSISAARQNSVFSTGDGDDNDPIEVKAERFFNMPLPIDHYCLRYHSPSIVSEHVDSAFASQLTKERNALLKYNAFADVFIPVFVGSCITLRVGLGAIPNEMPPQPPARPADLADMTAANALALTTNTVAGGVPNSNSGSSFSSPAKRKSVAASSLNSLQQQDTASSASAARRRSSSTSPQQQQQSSTSAAEQSAALLNDAMAKEKEKELIHEAYQSNLERATAYNVEAAHYANVMGLLDPYFNYNLSAVLGTSHSPNAPQSSRKGGARGSVRRLSTRKSVMASVNGALGAFSAGVNVNNGNPLPSPQPRRGSGSSSISSAGGVLGVRRGGGGKGPSAAAQHQPLLQDPSCSFTHPIVRCVNGLSQYAIGVSKAVIAAGSSAVAAAGGGSPVRSDSLSPLNSRKASSTAGGVPPQPQEGGGGDGDGGGLAHACQLINGSANVTSATIDTLSALLPPPTPLVQHQSEETGRKLSIYLLGVPQGMDPYAVNPTNCSTCTPLPMGCVGVQTEVGGGGEGGKVVSSSDVSFKPLASLSEEAFKRATVSFYSRMYRAAAVAAEEEEAAANTAESLNKRRRGTTSSSSGSGGAGHHRPSSAKLSRPSSAGSARAPRLGRNQMGGSSSTSNPLTSPRDDPLDALSASSPLEAGAVFHNASAKEMLKSLDLMHALLPPSTAAGAAAKSASSSSSHHHHHNQQYHNDHRSPRGGASRGHTTENGDELSSAALSSDEGSSGSDSEGGAFKKGRLFGTRRTKKKKRLFGGGALLEPLGVLAPSARAVLDSVPKFLHTVEPFETAVPSAPVLHSRILPQPLNAPIHSYRRGGGATTAAPPSLLLDNNEGGARESGMVSRTVSVAMARRGDASQHQPAAARNNTNNAVPPPAALARAPRACRRRGGGRAADEEEACANITIRIPPTITIGKDLHVLYVCADDPIVRTVPGEDGEEAGSSKKDDGAQGMMKRGASPIRRNNKNNLAAIATLLMRRASSAPPSSSSSSVAAEFSPHSRFLNVRPRPSPEDVEREGDLAFKVASLWKGLVKGRKNNGGGGGGGGGFPLRSAIKAPPTLGASSSASSSSILQKDGKATRSASASPTFAGVMADGPPLSANPPASASFNTVMWQSPFAGGMSLLVTQTEDSVGRRRGGGLDADEDLKHRLGLPKPRNAIQPLIIPLHIKHLTPSMLDALAVEMAVKAAEERAARLNTTVRKADSGEGEAGDADSDARYEAFGHVIHEEGASKGTPPAPPLFVLPSSSQMTPNPQLKPPRPTAASMASLPVPLVVIGSPE